MGRLHLIEIEDQPWCPAPIRDGGTDYLQITQELADLFGPIAPKLAQAVKRTGAHQVVDLCSGGAGPWHRLRASLAREGADVDVRLTDLHPNVDAFSRAEQKSGGRIVGERRSVDATAVPDDLSGFRTIFNGFHHFKPELGRAILADAVKRRAGIGIFEAVERTPLSILQILPATLAVLLLTPFIRPFRWSRLLLTYVVPAIPALVLFDGTVSCLRVYSPEELRALVEELGDTGYDWDIGQVKSRSGPGRLTYLIGVPKEAALSA